MREFETNGFAAKPSSEASWWIRVPSKRSPSWAQDLRTGGKVKLSGQAREEGEVMRRYKASTPAWSPSSTRRRMAAFQIEELEGGEDEESSERASGIGKSVVCKR